MKIQPLKQTPVPAEFLTPSVEHFMAKRRLSESIKLFPSDLNISQPLKR